MKPNFAKTDGQATVDQDRSQVLVVKSGGQQWVVGGTAQARCLDSEQSVDAPLPIHSFGPGHPEKQAHSWLGFVGERLRSWLVSVYARIVLSLDLLLQPELLKTSAAKPRQALFSIRRFTDSFQTGVILGLGLGCMSLILFHQMHIGVKGALVHAVQTGSTLPGYGSNTRIVIPSVRIYALESGSYPTLSTVRAAQVELRKKGVVSVVHSNVSAKGQKNYSLFTDVALNSKDLVAKSGQLIKLGFKSTNVVVITWNAQSVPVTSWSLNSPLATSVSRWLSADVSALNAITAVASDGAALRDASTAYQYSRSMVPSRSQLQSVSEGPMLGNIASLTAQAATSLNSGSKATVGPLITQAYEDLQSLVMTSHPIP